jgi:hypothetical protein
MNTKIIVYKNEDGSCGIVHPVEDMFLSDSKTRMLLRSKGIDFKNDEEVVAWVAGKDVPNNRPYRITDKSNIPSDRIFRDAWTDDNTTETVDVDLGKAKVIHLNNLRVLRQKEFEKLGFASKPNPDIEALLSQEVRDKLQVLRDIPQTINLDQAQTVDELKALVPDILKIG